MSIKQALPNKHAAWMYPREISYFTIDMATVDSRGMWIKVMMFSTKDSVVPAYVAHFFNLAELPPWMQERIAVLRMTEPEQLTQRNVTDVGWRSKEQVLGESRYYYFAHPLPKESPCT